MSTRKDSLALNVTESQPRKFGSPKGNTNEAHFEDLSVHPISNRVFTANGQSGKPRVLLVAAAATGIVLCLLALYFRVNVCEFAVHTLGNDIARAKVAQVRNGRSQGELHETLTNVREQLSGKLAIYLPHQLKTLHQFRSYIEPLRKTTGYLVDRRRSIKQVFDRRIRRLRSLPTELNSAATTYRRYASAEDELSLSAAYLAQGRACEQLAERIGPQISRYEELRSTALTEIGFLQKSESLLSHTEDYLDLSPKEMSGTATVDLLIQLNACLARYRRIIDFFKQLPDKVSAANEMDIADGGNQGSRK